MLDGQKDLRLNSAIKCALADLSGMSQTLCRLTVGNVPLQSAFEDATAARKSFVELYEAAIESEYDVEDYEKEYEVYKNEIK